MFLKIEESVAYKKATFETKTYFYLFIYRVVILLFLTLKVVYIEHKKPLNH